MSAQQMQHMSQFQPVGVVVNNTPVEGKEELPPPTIVTMAFSELPRGVFQNEAALRESLTSGTNRVEPLPEGTQLNENIGRTPTVVPIVPQPTLVDSWAAVRELFAPGSNRVELLPEDESIRRSGVNEVALAILESMEARAVVGALARLEEKEAFPPEEARLRALGSSFRGPPGFDGPRQDPPRSLGITPGIVVEHDSRIWIGHPSTTEQEQTPEQDRLRELESRFSVLRYFRENRRPSPETEQKEPHSIARLTPRLGEPQRILVEPLQRELQFDDEVEEAHRRNMRDRALGWRVPDEPTRQSIWNVRTEREVERIRNVRREREIRREQQNEVDILDGLQQEESPLAENWMRPRIAPGRSTVLTPLQGSRHYNPPSPLTQRMVRVVIEDGQRVIREVEVPITPRMHTRRLNGQANSHPRQLPPLRS